MAEPLTQLLERIAREEGVDPDLALAIAYQESGLNPNAVGDGGHSVGIYQLHDAGMGAGMGDARYDPETNARKALRALAQTAKQRPDLANNPGELAKASQRPSDPNYVASVNRLYQQLRSSGPSRTSVGAPKMAESTTDPQVERWQKGLAEAQAARDRLQAQREALEAAIAAPEPPMGAVQGPGIGPLRIGDRAESEAHQQWREARDKATVDLGAWDIVTTPQGRAWKAANEAVAKAETELAKAETQAAKTSRPPAPKTQVQNFGSAARPDWRRYNEDTDEWEPMANQPAGVPSSPTKTAEQIAAESAANVEQSRAAAEASRASATRAAKTPEQIAAESGASVEADLARTEYTRAQTDALKREQEAKTEALRIATMARDEIQAALALPKGPEQDAAVEAAVRKFAALTDPTKLLELGRQEADRKLREAELEQRRQEAEQTALAQRQTIAQRFADAAIQAETQHQRDFLPAEAAAGLAPLYQAFATGKAPQGLGPTLLPTRPSPASVGQKVFDAVMQRLAPISPTAAQHVQGGNGAPPAAPPPAPAPPQPIAAAASLAPPPPEASEVPPLQQLSSALDTMPPPGGGLPEPSTTPPGALDQSALMKLLRQMNVVPGAARAELAA